MVPALEEVVAVPAGSYRLGEPGEARVVQIGGVRIGRWPVTNAHVARFAHATGHPLTRPLAAKLDNAALADHPATDLTLDDANAFCAWASAELGEPIRLPTSDEWEALARGDDERPWPWGATFDESRCNCAESGWGWTVPVDKHPEGAGPFGAEQLAGNVWEWVADHTPDGWGLVRGGSYLDTAWGLRTSRALPADPARSTATTGFRIAIDNRHTARSKQAGERTDTAHAKQRGERTDTAHPKQRGERTDTAPPNATAGRRGERL